MGDRLAILFFLFCLLGLLFLLVKEERASGYGHVTVQGADFLYTTQIPISSTNVVPDPHAWVNHARIFANQAQNHG